MKNLFSIAIACILISCQERGVDSKKSSSVNHKSSRYDKAWVASTGYDSVAIALEGDSYHFWRTGCADIVPHATGKFSIDGDILILHDTNGKVSLGRWQIFQNDGVKCLRLHKNSMMVLKPDENFNDKDPFDGHRTWAGK